MRTLTPRRICFAGTHHNALKRSSKPYFGLFTVPFEETVYPIFSTQTGLSLFPKFGNLWRSIQNEDEYALIDSFFQQHQNTVFIRDTLALSSALSLNFDIATQARTPIGELEYQAKYQNHNESKNILADLMYEFCASTPYYQDMKAFCAIPPSDVAQENNLMSSILERMAARYGVNNVSSSISWQKNKPKLKELSFEDKWNALEQTGITITDDIQVDDVILVDDLYQSGITMQYVAMKLLEAGVKRVFGLAIVKSLGDSDNQS